jgi:hypothetical protein
MTRLDPRVEKSLRNTYDALALRGELISIDRMQASYAVFRSRFGPDVLKSLDGLALLNAMHTHGNKESLVYWLEFKNDDEFPGPTFGSIAGGSAHKFGLFRRKETTQWVTGSPKSEKNISEADAIILARKHRDQLFAGVETAIAAVSTHTDISPAAAGQATVRKTMVEPIDRTAEFVSNHRHRSIATVRKRTILRTVREANLADKPTASHGFAPRPAFRSRPKPGEKGPGKLIGRRAAGNSNPPDLAPYLSGRIGIEL